MTYLTRLAALLALVLLSACGGSGSSGSSSDSTTDTPKPLVDFEVETLSVAESIGSATVVLVLEEPSTLPVTVPILVSGTATEPDDASVETNELVIPAGEASGSLTITVSGLRHAETSLLRSW